MVAVTYGVARAAAGALKTKSRSKATGPNFLVRFVRAMQDARMRQAERELSLHQHLNLDPNETPFNRGW